MNPTLAGRLSPGIAAVLFGGLALQAGAIDIAGSLLIDLEAADYNAVDGQWPQHTPTGIPGNFLRNTSDVGGIGNATPRLQTVAGAPAIVLDGGQDYLRGPFTTSALHAAGAVHSVEYWVYQGHARAEESVLSWSYRQGEPPFNNKFAGFRYGSNPQWGAIARFDNDLGFAAPHSPTPELGKWHLISATYDGNIQRLYVDGVLNGQKTVGVLDARDTQPIYVGTERAADGSDSGIDRQFSGAIGKIRVHAGVLTDANVLNNYNLEKTAFTGATPVALTRPPSHRWSFNNAVGPAPEGTTITDSIGGLDAVVRGNNATFVAGTGAGNNVIQLPGGPGGENPAYVDLPNGLISGNNRVSIELWATQSGNRTWSRVASFGTTNNGEISAPGGGFDGNSTEALVLFANRENAASNAIQRSRGTISNGADVRISNDSVVLGTQFHYVIVFDPDQAEWRLYRNGLLMETLPETQGPTTIRDVNNWLGRSEFSGDQFFNGSFDEVRVYNYTLSEAQILGNRQAGPNTLNIGTQPSVFAWTPTAAGTYAFNDNANWGGNPFPDAAGAFANMAKNLAGDQTVNLNTQATGGSLSFGDSDSSNRVTIAAGTGGSLEMNAGTGNVATLTQSTGSAGDIISAPITLTTDTTVSNAAPVDKPLTIAGTLSGPGKFTKTGSGPVALTGNNTGYAGTIAINSGELVVGDGGTTGTLGSGPIQTTNRATLLFDRTDNVTFSQTVTGGGLVRFLGGGTFTNTGTIANTGTLDVQQGTLINDATINGVQSIRSDNTAIFRGNSTTNINGWTVFGITNGANITVQDNATINITAQGELNVGDVGGTTTLRMTGGNIGVNALFIGKNDNVNGYLFQSGGSIIDRSGGNDNRIGGNDPEDVNGTGAYILSGGSLETNTNLMIGGRGTGSFIQTGGTVNSTGGWTAIARYSEPGSRSTGLLDLRGGTHTHTGGDQGMLVSEEGDGVLEVRGTGELNISNRLVVGGRDANSELAAEQSGYGVVNLATGGTITTGFVAQDSSNNGVPYGVFNFHGGTLKAGRSVTDFFQGLDEARIYPEGATINTNGFNVTIEQPLDDPSGNGVATIPVINGGSGYLAPPIIKISSANILNGGSGATALAVINEAGTVTGITITNPGTGYASQPTVTIVGQGSGTGLTLGTPILTPELNPLLNPARPSGQLTKTGAGNLRINGFGDFSGNTVVSAGGLGGRGRLSGHVQFQPGSSFAARVVDGNADNLIVEGTLNLGANVSFGADVTGSLTPGTAYVVATYTALTGSFTGINLPPGWTVDTAYQGNSIAIVEGEGSPYDNWILGFYPGVTDINVVGQGADPDNDGVPNSLEYTLGGAPNSGSNRSKVYSIDTDNGVVVTFAVLPGTTFTGNTATSAGFTYTVQGSTDLGSFTAPVEAVAVVAPAEAPTPPTGYEYRSFRLSGAAPVKGFLRVQVTP